MMAMYHGHRLGHTIRALRTMAKAGASVIEMMTYLHHHTNDVFIAQQYLSKAFGLSLTHVMSLFPAEASDPRIASIDDRIRRTRPLWEKQVFAELMRVRDYVSFIRFAKSERLVVTLFHANYHSGRFIGRAGHRCYGGALFVVTRRTSPCEGLVAADPGDSCLLDALSKFAIPLSYAEYVDCLQASGYRILGPDDGYVVEDAWGNRFYEGYRLHGVYSADSGEPVWSGKRGDRLLVTINRLLGSDLVLEGPHDDWSDRNDKTIAGPLWGPHAPCIEFNTEGGIRHLLSVKDLARHSRWQSHHWRRIYPHHVGFLGDQGEES
jgi:hypothetical protein